MRVAWSICNGTWDMDHVSRTIAHASRNTHHVPFEMFSIPQQRLQRRFELASSVVITGFCRHSDSRAEYLFGLVPLAHLLMQLPELVIRRHVIGIVFLYALEFPQCIVAPLELCVFERESIPGKRVV